MLTWSDVRAKLRRAIIDVIEDENGDPLTDSQGNPLSPDFSEEDLADFWTDAQDDLVQYVARTARFTIDEGDTEATLPADCYRIVAVVNGDGYQMLQMDEYESADIDVWTGCYWYIEGGEIHFTDEIPDNDAAVIYQQYYPVINPDELDAPIEIPRWAIRAAIYYCTAEALERKLVEDPDLRRWASRATDAGNPTHNPFLQVVIYFHERYEKVVFSHVGDASEVTGWPSSSR